MIYLKILYQSGNESYLNITYKLPFVSDKNLSGSGFNVTNLRINPEIIYLESVKFLLHFISC